MTMTKHKTHTGGEEGFILPSAVLIIALLTLIGITASNTTNLELHITSNDKLARECFHRADGGLEVGIEMVEQNVSCPGGFSTAPSGFDSTDPATLFALMGVDIADARFAFAPDMTAISGSPSILDALPADNARSLRIPVDPASRNDNGPHTNIAMWGVTEYITGNAIQMALLTRGMSSTTAIKILSRSVGSTILAASTSAQDALEGYHGHGLFTYTLVRGLLGEADLAKTGVIETIDLAKYVDMKVPDISERVFKKRQYPTIEIHGQPFPIGKVVKR
jgi:hypothetical protein